MSFFSGLDFFVWLVLLLVPAVILGVTERPMRLYRLAASIVMVLLVYQGEQLFWLVGSVVFYSYLVQVYAYLRRRYGKNVVFYGHAIAFALAPLVVSKLSGLIGDNVVGFLGISYITFRVLQVIIETYDGLIERINPREFLSFLIFFPTLSSGPIDRSRRFGEDDASVPTRSEYLEMLGLGLGKIVLGLVYKVVLSDFFFQLLNEYFAERYRPIFIIGYAYVYGLYLFFDFAGYSAMAVGASYVLGIRVPDNFRRPFLSVDIKDFWNRWHISLSTWFRDFVFTRFMMDSIRKKRFSSRLSAASAAFMVNMLVMGVWHGLEPHYIAYGLYHGCLLAATETYQKKSKFYKAHKGSKVYRAVSWFVTMNLVMFGFLIFSGHLAVIWNAVKDVL